MEGHLRQPIATRYSLLSRLRNWDDQESWREFFETYWPLIYRTALKAGLNEAEAEDVVQETILSVARDIAKFKRQPDLGSFKGWLLNVVRWRIGDQLRERGRHNPSGQASPEDDFASAQGPLEQTVLEDIWEKEWRENLLATAIARVKLVVKEEHFQLFDLAVLQAVPVPEITKRLGVSRAAIYLAKHRVSRLVRKYLEELEAKPI